MSAHRRPGSPLPCSLPDPRMHLPRVTFNIQPATPKSRADPLRGETGAPRLEDETDRKKKLSSSPQAPASCTPAVGAGPLGSRGQVAEGMAPPCPVLRGQWLGARRQGAQALKTVPKLRTWGRRSAGRDAWTARGSWGGREHPRPSGHPGCHAGQEAPTVSQGHPWCQGTALCSPCSPVVASDPG